MFLYTETAFHHEGDKEFILELIKASKFAGAQACKFQVLLDYDGFISSLHPSYESFKTCLFSRQDWIEILEFTHKIGLGVVFMPCDTQAITLIKELSFLPKFIDIHSVSFHDAELLYEIKSLKIPIILGIGGRLLDEIEAKINFFEGLVDVLMVGFQAFPTPIEEVSFEKVRFLKETFPTLQIGYADHSVWNSDDVIATHEWALLLGATVFEKHITTAPGVDRLDWQSASSIDTIKKIISRLNYIHNKVLNKPSDIISCNSLNNLEEIYRNREKYVVAAKDIPSGTILTEDLVHLKMTGDEGGINTKFKVLGLKTNVTLKKDEKLNAAMLIK